MAATNLNIRTDKDIRDQADWIFSDRENGIPFALNLDVPNETTAAAIEEGNEKETYLGVLCFRQFYRHFVFVEDEEGNRNKRLEKYYLTEKGMSVCKCNYGTQKFLLGRYIVEQEQQGAVKMLQE